MQITKGFTLIEMTMVLVIITLAITSLLTPVRMQLAQANVRETEQALEQIKDALISYSAVNGQLPCPALSYRCSDGYNTGAGKAAVALCGQEGFLPWADLGVEKCDHWGRPFRYRAGGAIEVTVADPPSSATAAVTTSAVAAVIFSYGEDTENDGVSANDNKNYTQGGYVPERFDDILVWVSKNVLL